MFFSLFSKPKVKVNAGKTNPVVLVILDGWGIAPASDGNAITLANPDNYNNLLANYPHSELLASGESVGLPANEVGNTEVGHLNIGAGRVILQDLPKINKAIQDGSFFENRAFYHAGFHAQKNNSKIHIMGLVSTGKVHSSIDHLYALLEFFQKTNNTRPIYIHLFTDGRDAPPQEGINVVTKLEDYLNKTKSAQIATISGRYYAMDRDKRWDRTKKTYEAMVKAIGPTATSASEALKASYAAGITDEFIVPTIINKNGLVENNDAAVFFNFRIDRPRQLTMSFVIKDFTKSNLTWEFDPYAVDYEHKHEGDKEVVLDKEPFARGGVLSNLYFVTMTQYQKNIPVNDIGFPPEIVSDCLSVILSKNNIEQMHMAESEKERFVTYYFDGLREEKQEGEDVAIVPSPHVPTYDKKPEMSVYSLTEEFKKVLNKDMYKFIVMNIANADMVGHTGNIQATIKAIKAVDACLKEIAESVMVCNGTLLITADHGNAEQKLRYDSSSFFFTSDKGKMSTDHTTNPVPFIAVSKNLFRSNKQIPKGILADISPTILKLLGLEIPPVMTGKNLLS
ncbi:MAG TPA: 2,3-bisphosphoglycerate-independent phosphoglycerate mutase [Patescibacteria group bacterium]|nr:2,3-bisphosphoglycerate-independent phosphoglycerate mutase [Patescibacteria group bacterium]